VTSKASLKVLRVFPFKNFTSGGSNEEPRVAIQHAGAEAERTVADPDDVSLTEHVVIDVKPAAGDVGWHRCAKVFGCDRLELRQR
jgi:hypothetical protein